MEAITNLVMIVVGLGFATMAFLKGVKIGGAFTKGPYFPISRVGRVAAFIGGALVAVEGLRRLLGRPPFEIDLARWFSG